MVRHPRHDRSFQENRIVIVSRLPLHRLLCAPLVAAVMALAPPAWAQTAAPPTPAAPTPADGTWVGRAQGGNCAPLDVRITIESGLLDGTAIEPDAGTPKVQGKKGETLPPPPALWQLNGRVASSGAVDIFGLRSMRDRDRQRSRW
ncbi:MAG: hypothetical protein KIT36_20000, partial [Alphaproteobacteria bacterium]|nr:hypothetical protein [Alphaproteobacteria bacterium]